MGGEGDDKGKTASGGKRPSWMMPAVSHGYHVAEDRSFVAALSRGLELEPDKVVVQREEIQENELWFFGVFDARIGDGVSKYIQAHLFDKKVKEVNYGSNYFSKFLLIFCMCSFLVRK